MDNSNDCHYAKIIVIMMMTSIAQLNRDGDAHVHGLDVLYCVGWFGMNGFCVSGCVLGLLCVCQGLGYKNGEGSCATSRKR